MSEDCHAGDNYGGGFEELGRVRVGQRKTTQASTTKPTWTKEPPTVPGLYWWRASMESKPRGDPVRVRRQADWVPAECYAGRMVVDDPFTRLTEDAGGLWSGPLAPPS